MTTEGQTPQDLPAWLTKREPYTPPRDRDAFLRRNMLALVSLLQVFRTPACPEGVIDTALSRVNPALRLIGMLVCVVCVTSARNMSFVWIALAVLLVSLATKPPRRLAAVLRPALVVAGLALIVNIPAAAFGNTQAPSRMAIKSLITSSIVLNLANSVQTERLFGALATLHVPTQIVFILDLAVRDLVLLGQVASNLAEALALRCVGKNRDKSSSAAGVMGMTFIKANDLARQQAEALACRGFDGTFEMERDSSFSIADALYIAGIMLVIVVFVYLERAI